MIDSAGVGELLGWVRTILTQLGIWDFLSVFMQVTILLALTGRAIAFLRGSNS